MSVACKEVLEKAQKAKEASARLSVISTEVKNKALREMGERIKDKASEILAANKIDIEAANKKQLSKTLVDRLTLNEQRIQAMIEGLETVKKLPDPIGETMAQWDRPNGLHIIKQRVPLGVIGIIYEARPNVTVDAAALCLKAGNAVILRGGSDAINSNKALVKVISEAACKAGIPEGAIELIETTDRSAVNELLKLNRYINVLIPRGGKELIQMVVQNSTVPVIETGEGNCHAYVHEDANLEKAVSIVVNAKVQRPSVCNAIESLLVDKKIAASFIPKIIESLRAYKVEIRGCQQTRAIDPSVIAATEEDFYTEYLDLILAIKIVSGIKEAINHINKYGTHHSEVIITENKTAAEKFTREIDSAAVFVNASTRFTDGFEFGFGAEIGISTQKLHARGPMGLPELTSYKYIILGNGQVRGTLLPPGAK